MRDNTGWGVTHRAVGGPWIVCMQCMSRTFFPRIQRSSACHINSTAARRHARRVRYTRAGCSYGTAWMLTSHALRTPSPLLALPLPRRIDRRDLLTSVFVQICRQRPPRFPKDEAFVQHDCPNNTSVSFSVATPYTSTGRRTRCDAHDGQRKHDGAPAPRLGRQLGAHRRRVVFGVVHDARDALGAHRGAFRRL